MRRESVKGHGTGWPRALRQRWDPQVGNTASHCPVRGYGGGSACLTANAGPEASTLRCGAGRTRKTSVREAVKAQRVEGWGWGSQPELEPPLPALRWTTYVFPPTPELLETTPRPRLAQDQ